MPKPKNLEETAYRYIFEQIDSKKWLPQTHITEQMVSMDLGISRTPVRKAFIRLQEDKYLTLVPNRGARINEKMITTQDYQERLTFLELVSIDYLHQLQIKEIIFDAAPMEKILKNLEFADENKDDKRFTDMQTQVIRGFFVYGKNRYMISLVMDTLRELQIQKNEELKPYMPASRKLQIKHFWQLIAFLKKSEYAMARKEVRILINQLMLNIIQGV